jgi:hypothetical protein
MGERNDSFCGTYTSYHFLNISAGIGGPAFGAKVVLDRSAPCVAQLLRILNASTA